MNVKGEDQLGSIQDQLHALERKYMVDILPLFPRVYE